MLPAVANRYQPALAVIQSATLMRERVAREDNSVPGMPQGKPPVPAKNMQAINEHYFGTSLTPMEAMFALVEKAVDYLNDKLNLGRDGDADGIKAGNEWRDEALRDNIKVNSDRDFSIPKPGENGVSFRAVAKMIQDTFDTGYLSRDTDLGKLLEDTVGFRLDGMSVADLFEAFVEPEGDAAKRVYDVLSDGLAGQPGGKVTQRLEAAASGPKSVEETVADQGKSSIDVVDEETLAEDLEAIKAAEAKEKLEEAAAIPEKVENALKEARQDESSENGTSSQAMAAAAIQALTGLESAASSKAVSDPVVVNISIAREKPTYDEQSEPGQNLETSIASHEAAGTAPDAREPKTDTLRGVLAHYLEFIEANDNDKRPAFSIRL